jgi:hypothetical protein
VSRADAPRETAAVGRDLRPPVGRWVYLHLLGLGALAFGQPLFELLAGSPEFYPARGGDRVDVICTIALALLVAPRPWLALVAAARRWPGPAADAVAALAVGSLVGLVVLRGLALTDAPPLVDLAIVAATVVLSAWAYLRSPTARSFASWLTPAIVVVPALFALDPGISRILSAVPHEIPLHQSGARTPVAIVVLDELPLASLLDASGALDARRAPHLAAFAREATWFRDAAAPSGTTATALPAILSGRLAPRADAEQHLHNLFTMLGDYPTYSVEAWSTLCPGEHNLLASRRRPDLLDRILLLGADLPVVWVELVTPPAWRHDMPALTGGWDRFVAGPDAAPPRRRRGKIGHLGRRPDLEAFLASIAARDRALYFGHLVFPHEPWEYLPSGRTYACKPECYPSARVEDEPWRAAQLYQRYLLQLGYADAIVGEIVARLRSVGLYDRSLVIVLADHGASFEVGARIRSTDPATLGETIAVPLLVKQPGQSVAAVVDTPVSTLDLVATVAEQLHVRPPWPVPGRSFFAGGRGKRAYLTFTDNRLRAVPADLAARVRAARDGYAAMLRGSGGDPERIGPLPGLLGTRSAPDREAPGIGLSLDEPGRFAAVDMKAETLPLLVTGTLDGASRDDGCCTLAVAVEGSVVATTHSYWTSDGRHRMAVLLPESALRPGNLDLTVDAVAPDGRTLHQIRLR